MTPNRKRLPNFEKLTLVLNKQNLPRRTLRLLGSVCKPPINSIQNRKQESEVCIT
jgi:hypothetical protein